MESNKDILIWWVKDVFVHYNYEEKGFDKNFSTHYFPPFFFFFVFFISFRTRGVQMKLEVIQR